MYKENFFVWLDTFRHILMNICTFYKLVVTKYSFMDILHGILRKLDTKYGKSGQSFM